MIQFRYSLIIGFSVCNSFPLENSLSYSEFWFLSGNNNPSKKLVVVFCVSSQYPDDFSKTEDAKNPLMRDSGEAASPARDTFCLTNFM
jgi:hypothetical protein